MRRGDVMTRCATHRRVARRDDVAARTHLRCGSYGGFNDLCERR